MTGTMPFTLCICVLSELLGRIAAAILSAANNYRRTLSADCYASIYSIDTDVCLHAYIKTVIITGFDTDRQLDLLSQHLITWPSHGQRWYSLLALLDYAWEAVTLLVPGGVATNSTTTATGSSFASTIVPALGNNDVGMPCHNVLPSVAPDGYGKKCSELMPIPPGQVSKTHEAKLSQ